MSKKLNILFLGGAKRVSMARKFIAAAKSRGLEAVIFDSETKSPVALQCIAQVVDGHRWSEPGAVDALVALCREKDIRLVVPFVDNGVAVAAKIAAALPGQVFAPVGDASGAALMFDKVLSAKAFAAKGLPVPRTFDPARDDVAVCLPLIAKPRYGSASKGIVPIDKVEDLNGLDFSQYLVQQRIDRRREITVDCYARVSDGTVCACVPRVRDEVAGGEVVRTTVLHIGPAVQIARQAITSLGLRGAVTVQIIENLDDHSFMIMEINPRLGGGAVAAVHAGADLPGMIIDEASGCQPQPIDDYKDMIVTRYLDEVAFAF